MKNISIVFLILAFQVSSKPPFMELSRAYIGDTISFVYGGPSDSIYNVILDTLGYGTDVYYAETTACYVRVYGVGRSSIDGWIKRKSLKSEITADSNNTNWGLTESMCCDRIVELYFGCKKLRVNASIKKLIFKHSFTIGMTTDMVVLSIGFPDDINRTITAHYEHEQWVYRDYDMYLYFKNGILTSWQD